MTTIKTFAMSDHATLILHELAKHLKKSEADVIEQLIIDYVIHDLDKEVAAKIIEGVKTK